MNKNQEDASAFLARSALQWTEEMAPSQIVTRDSIVNLLAVYKRSVVTNDSRPPMYSYFRLTYRVGGTKMSSWARQDAGDRVPVNDQQIFELCNAAGEPLPGKRIRLKQGTFETSPARLTKTVPRSLEME